MGSMLELEKEVAELKDIVKHLKQRMLTSEIQAGVMSTTIIHALNALSSGKNVPEKIIESLRKGKEKAIELGAVNDPHTNDAFEQAIKCAERALKK
jgi:t-SNARE complex subunit (syntaxin)